MKVLKYIIIASFFFVVFKFISAFLALRNGSYDSSHVEGIAPFLILLVISIVIYLAISFLKNIFNVVMGKNKD